MDEATLNNFQIFSSEELFQFQDSVAYSGSSWFEQQQSQDLESDLWLQTVYHFILQSINIASQRIVIKQSAASEKTFLCWTMRNEEINKPSLENFVYNHHME